MLSPTFRRSLVKISQLEQKSILSARKIILNATIQIDSGPYEDNDLKIGSILEILMKKCLDPEMNMYMYKCIYLNIM